MHRYITHDMPAFFVASLLLTQPVLAQEDPDETTVAPYPIPVIIEYDPADGKPAGVGDHEDGLASQTYETGGTFDPQDTPNGVKVTDEDSSIGVTPTTILPNDADQDLKDHETAHHTLAKEEYDANAKKKIDTALNGFVGKVFVGAGATQQEQQDDAAQQANDEYKKRWGRATSAIEQQGQTINDKFDKLTDHGRGTADEKTDDGDPLSTDAGLEETRAEKAKAPDAGKQAYIPNQTSQPYLLASNTTLDVDDATDLITLSGTATINGGVAASDSTFGAAISISDLIYVGMLGNGAGLVSDGAISITDPASGRTLLDGFLFELAFMPSGIDGFTSMLQGYLDVPPVFAGGVDPTGSEVLGALNDTADNASQLSMFYYLFDDPVPIDSYGNLTDTSLNGTIKIGIAPVALPNSLTLALASLGVLLTLSQRRSPMSALAPS